MSTDRSREHLSAFLLAGALGLASLTSCSEVEVGPLLDTPVPASNACLDLSTADSAELQSPTGLLAVFDCLNSEQSFNALRSPLAYLVASNLLRPYFEIPGYLDPLGTATYVQGGDLQLTVQSLEALINDPQAPLDALLDFYVELHETGLLTQLTWLGQHYSASLYEGCAEDLETCRMSVLLDMANELYFSEDVAILQDAAAASDVTVSPEVTNALVADVLEIAEQTTREGSPTGENLLLSLTAAFAIDPLEDDPDRTVDDPYVARQFTLLQALQKPLCQLRSDRDSVDGFVAMSSQLSSTGQTDYLPLYLRTLVNVSPYNQPRTTTAPDTSDADQDGFSIAEGDCNDFNVTVYPGAPELADRIDNDCDLVADLTLAKDDLDGDKVSPNAGDCDDTDVNSHPGLKVYESNGGITIVDRAEEILGDGKDNDCDGFTDHIPSSLEIVLKVADTLMPTLYAAYNSELSNLGYGLSTVVNSGGASFDLEALLYANDALIQSIISNLSNGTFPPDMTALLRETLPVAYVLADMGLLSTSSLGAVGAIWQDHLDYKAAYDAASSSEQQAFTQYKDSCGEQFERYVDTVAVLDELVRVLDAYKVIREPNVNALIPIVVNSDLLLDLAKIPPNATGAPDTEVVNAGLNLFDYFLAPPEDSGLYGNNYGAARIWTLMPMLQVIYDHPEDLDTMDGLTQYILDGLADPDSALQTLPTAIDALSRVDTGGTVDSEGMLENLLTNPEVRPILANFLAIPADGSLIAIVTGSWSQLTEEQRATYQTEESTYAFMARWIQDGVVGRLLDLAGYMLEWVIENTGLGSPVSTSASTDQVLQPGTSDGP